MIYFYNDIDATNSIRISNSEIAELDLVAKIKESDLDKYLKKYFKKDTNIWFYYDLPDLAEDYNCQYVQNDEFGLWYTDENIVESKKSARKSMKESRIDRRKIMKESKGVDKLDVQSLCYYCSNDLNIEIWSYYNATDEVKMLDSFKRKNFLGSAYKYSQVESFEIDDNEMIIYLNQDAEIM